MRYLITLFMFCSLAVTSSHAQCFLEASARDIVCTADSFSLSMRVRDWSGRGWSSPELGVDASNVLEGEIVGPFATSMLGQSVSIVDLEDVSCTYTLELPEDACSDPCFGRRLILSDFPRECGFGAFNVSVFTKPSSFTVRMLNASDVVIESLDIDLENWGFGTAFSANPGEYRVEVVFDDGCVISEDFTLGQFNVEIAQNGSSCLDETVSLSINTFACDGQQSILWSTGETTSEISPVQAGETYWVEVVKNGYTGRDTITVAGQTDYIIADWLGSSVPIPCGEDSVLLEATNLDPDLSYTWRDEIDGEVIGTGPSIMAHGSGGYLFQGTDESGCVFTDYVDVYYLDYRDAAVQVQKNGPELLSEFTIILNDIYIRDDGPITVEWDGPPGFTSGDPPSPPQTYLYGYQPGLYTVTITSECGTRQIEVDMGNELTSMSGTVIYNLDGNCNGAGENRTGSTNIVSLTNTGSGRTYYTRTDTAGAWETRLPSGDYAAEVVLPESEVLLDCPPLEFNKGDEPLEGINLTVAVLEDCAVLRTDVTIPFLRRCFASSAYVTYRNDGTVGANDATVTVTIDPLWIDVTTSVPPLSVDGEVYTFAVGDLAPFASGQIGFQFVVSCEAELGQAHCLEANISPQDFCDANSAWNGALVEITDVVCDGDSLRFTIENTGSGSMSVPLSYVVVEDGIMLSEDPFVNGLLEANEEYEVSLAADGRTYSISTNQEPFAPGSDNPTVVFEGCNGNPDFSLGFTNLLPLNSGNPGSSLVCRENIGAFDPNDKMGYPLGWEEGNILPGTKLDYEIRFQNTGTDTAFTVVIRDTISPALDLATFQMGSASHGYTVAIDTHRVITWTFDDIRLVDSFTNAALSQGALTFSMAHVAELEPGDEILNAAAIYFDFNEPVITNVSRHVIAAEGLPVSVRDGFIESVPLTVYPNPADGQIRVEVSANDQQPGDVLLVTDSYGRVVLTQLRTTNERPIVTAGLSPGYYVLLLSDDAGTVRGRTPFVILR